MCWPGICINWTGRSRTCGFPSRYPSRQQTLFVKPLVFPAFAFPSLQPKQDKIKMISWVLASQLHKLQGGGADTGNTGCTLPPIHEGPTSHAKGFTMQCIMPPPIKRWKQTKKGIWRENVGDGDTCLPPIHISTHFSTRIMLPVAQKRNLFSIPFMGSQNESHSYITDSYLADYWGDGRVLCFKKHQRPGEMVL